MFDFEIVQLFSCSIVQSTWIVFFSPDSPSFILSSGVGKVGRGKCSYFRKVANFSTVELLKFSKLSTKFIMA